MFSLPTYERCVDICNQTDPTLFYEQKFILDGFKVSIFNYRLARFEDFQKYQSFEMRGITFVFNQDGSLYRRFPLIEKFFNLNENESTRKEKVIELKIKSVREKADGSVVNFIKLPNGKILAKSKTSFDSDQAKMAQSIFENDPKTNSFVTDCLNKQLNPHFELVSPKNRIVVNYDTTKLILLGVRDEHGQYQNLEEFDFITTELTHKSLDELLDIRTKIENTEGWVVEFDGGLKIKIKTEWYVSLHRILTDYSNREDYLIDMVLDNKIDDLYSQIDVNSESYKFIKSVESKTLENIKRLVDTIQVMTYNFDGDFKEFASKYNKHQLFGLCTKILRGQDELDVIKEYIKKKTYRLFEAREWLNQF
jgi:T4 RnlA family RNA ligase